MWVWVFEDSKSGKPGRNKDTLREENKAMMIASRVRSKVNYD